MESSLVTPDPQAILQAWMPFKQIVGVTSVHSREEYERAHAMIDTLLKAIGDQEGHPLAEWLDLISDQVRAYEEENFPIPQAEPHDVLRFLMDQHGLKQNDLQDCAPQSRISEILNGTRSISKEIAKRLARRFCVRVDVFM
ncbi:MAG: transcriptional regulator [Nitrospirae bacterium]|nr:transcriptional regulator [Magnetococcales bacterium]HAT51561.1 transcriptional regulator [Alphaproteobacteria bacterium]